MATTKSSAWQGREGWAWCIALDVKLERTVALRTGNYCSPDPVAIPRLGTFEMVSTDVNYNVQWPVVDGGDPFTPPLTSVGVGFVNNTAHTSKGSTGGFGYVTAPSQGVGLTQGGGNVKIKGALH